MPLTTRNKVKSYLNIAALNTADDSFIDDLILDVQAMIEGHCQRHFDVHTYTNEKHNIMHKIFTHEYPIKSVSSVVRSGFDESDVGETAYRIFESYLEMLDAKYITMTNKTKYANAEESYVEITYSAGYDESEMPRDLQTAATEMVMLKYKDYRESRLGISQESAGAVSTSYEKRTSEFPDNILKIVNRYKKVRV